MLLSTAAGYTAPTPAASFYLKGGTVLYFVGGDPVGGNNGVYDCSLTVTPVTH
jgi:hypothetical protein